MDDIEAELTVAQDGTEGETTNGEQIKTVRLNTDYNDHRIGTSFLKTNRRCLKRIRDAMLLHNWQEAAVYYNSYIQTLETMCSFKVRSTASEIMWRLGTEILRHLPNSSAEDFNAVYEQLKNNGVKDFSKICLEHCFHLLLNGQMEEARRQLSIGESWRYGNISIAQGDTKKIIHAYCGFLDYLFWCEKKSFAAATDDEGIGNHDMNVYFRQASVTLKEIISQPGVWDPFVLSYIHMLEFYNDEEGALQILENYAYNNDFPANPNAHVYLFQFLKRHNAPQSKLIRSLRTLRSLVPSHELMLELCSLLLHTSLMRDLEEALAVSMDLLEFSSWKCDIKAWSCLLNIMKLLKQKECKEFVKKEWDARLPLWFPLHFRSYIGKIDMVKNVELMKIKREVLRVVGIHSSDYIRCALTVKRNSEIKDCTVREKENTKMTTKLKKKGGKKTRIEKKKIEKTKIEKKKKRKKTKV